MDDKLVLDMFGEVYKELRAANTKIDTGHKDIMAAMSNNKELILDKMNTNREEFVIFKTKVNTRTAMISAVIGIAIAAVGLFLQHHQTHKEPVEQVKYEQIYNKTT